jgi:hypothetical protein
VSADAHDREGCRRRTPGREQLTDLHLDELEDFLVVDHVALVERNDHRGHADLAGEQHVLTRLGHGAVGRRNHEDRAVHLSGTGDHVLDVVGVAGAVNVRVVALLGLVLDVRDRDRDTALTLFGRLVDLVERREASFRSGNLSCSTLVIAAVKRRLAVVDVTDGADVHVRLGPLELCLRHLWSSSGLSLVERRRLSGRTWRLRVWGYGQAYGSLPVSLTTGLLDDLLGHRTRHLGI